MDFQRLLKPVPRLWISFPTPKISLCYSQKFDASFRLLKYIHRQVWIFIMSFVCFEPVSPNCIE
jgi:hypothetical protein